VDPGVLQGSGVRRADQCTGAKHPADALCLVPDPKSSDGTGSARSDGHTRGARTGAGSESAAHAIRKITTAAYMAEHDRISRAIDGLDDSPTNSGGIDPDRAIAWLTNVGIA